MPATTHIIDWKLGIDANANKPPLTIITDPESIQVGDVISISLYSAYPYQLISPYNGLSSKTVKAGSGNKAIEDVIDLSGSTDVSAKFPIASVVSAVAAIALVDETTRQVVLSAGMPLGALVSVVNQKLVINSALKLHGSIKLIYKTFDAQQWTHSSFAQKGAALLFAYNETFANYENVPLTISERAKESRDSIKIDGYAKSTAQAYAGFIVYPSDANPLVLTDAGSTSPTGIVSHIISREQISFSGKTASASFVIDSLIDFRGYFFDAKHNVVSPSVSVSDGELAANIDCYGVGFITYKTSGATYDYFAKKTSNNSGGLYPSWTTTIGTIFAFDRDKVGIAATYDIPPIELVGVNRESVLEVYRDVIVVGEQMFEMPDGATAYPDDNDYIAYPMAGDKPPLGEAYAVTQWVHESIYVSNGNVVSDLLAVTYYAPTPVEQAFPAKFKLTDNIPTEASEDFPQSVIDELWQTRADLIAKYGIE